MTSSPDLSRLTPLISEAASVGGEVELGRLLRSLVAEARRATDARYVALGVLGEHNVLSEFIYEGIDPEHASKIGQLPTGKGVLGTVISKNETIVVDEIGAHPDSVGFPPNHPPMSNFLGVPVAVGDETFGNLYLTDKPGGFTDQDVGVVQALSRIAGTAVHTSRLQTRLRRLAIVEDRQRIARDLHDSVIQDLFAVGLSLQSVTVRVTDPEGAVLLDASIDTLDAAVNALRNYIFELRDSSKSAITIEERLQTIVSRMRSAYPAQVDLEVEPVSIDDRDEDVVLLTTEALSNALRHSRAENVEISIFTDGPDLVVRIKDDGRGFDPTRVDRGMGLANMNARAKSLGGTLEVESRPEEGTLVEARLPLS